MYTQYAYDDGVPLCALIQAALFCPQDTLILGSVGTNTWKGSLQNFQGPTMTQIEDSDMETDSYMGMKHQIHPFLGGGGYMPVIYFVLMSLTLLQDTLSLWGRGKRLFCISLVLQGIITQDRLYFSHRMDRSGS